MNENNLSLSFKEEKKRIIDVFLHINELQCWKAGLVILMNQKDKDEEKRGKDEVVYSIWKLSSEILFFSL